MSRGEPISSPDDPTPSGFCGTVTRNPSRPQGGPSEVTEPACEECGLGFRPARPHHTVCPECWKLEQPRRALSAQEAAIEEAERNWERTQKRWGKG